VIGQEEPNHPSPVTSHPKDFVFLNNALLTAGHAVRYEGGAKEE